jgi:hypothetical protein
MAPTTNNTNHFLVLQGMQVSALQLKLLERSSELSRCQDALSLAHQQLQVSQGCMGGRGCALVPCALELLLCIHSVSHSP